MRVEIKECNNEVFGIDLIAENASEQDIIQKFWRVGIQTSGIANANELSLIFDNVLF